MKPEGESAGAGLPFPDRQLRLQGCAVQAVGEDQGALGQEKGPWQQPGGRGWGMRGLLKPEVTAHGDPVLRPDLEDVLQLLDGEGAGTAHQHL